VHFVAAMENRSKSTVPTDSQVMTKNKTCQLNHSVAYDNYAIYLAIHTKAYGMGMQGMWLHLQR